MQQSLGNKKPLKIVLLLCLALIIFALICYAIAFVLVLQKEQEKTAVKPADCAIVLGAKVFDHGPSYALEARLKVALDLYRNAQVSYIIVCGGQGIDEPMSEAEGMRTYLVARGVPEDIILLDDTSTSTVENLEYAKRIMQAHHLESAIICTNDYHAFRAQWQAKDIGLHVVGVAKSDLPLSNKWVLRAREALSILRYFFRL